MKKAISISLALLILLTNAGLAINTHFCGGLPVESSISIGIHNLDCGMPNMDGQCSSTATGEDQFIPTPCCDNQHQVIQLDENAHIPLFAFSLDAVFILSFVQLFIHPVQPKGQVEILFAQYAPPKPERDIFALFQTFLI